MMTLEEAQKGLERALERQYIHECANDMYYSSPQRKEDLKLIKHWSDKLKGLKDE